MFATIIVDRRATGGSFGDIDPKMLAQAAQAAGAVAKPAGKILGGLQRAIRRKKTQLVEVEGRVKWGQVAVVGGIVVAGLVAIPLVARAIR